MFSSRFLTFKNALENKDVFNKSWVNYVKVHNILIFRSSHQKCSVKKGVLINFAKFAGEHLEAEACNFIKKETLAQVFFRESFEISKNTFFTEHLRTTASECSEILWWVKMSATMVDQGQKILKKHWLKRPKAMPQKSKLGPKYKWFKISYL